MPITSPLPLALLGTALAMSCHTAVAQESKAVATLGRIDGETMVSQNGRYIDGSEGMRLVEGQRVMAVSRDVVIRYDDGCVYRLPQGKLLVIENQSTCVLGIDGSEGSAVGLGWVPPAAAATVGVLGASLPTGSDDRRNRFAPLPPISR